jgi:hypothetical protein
VGGLKFRAGASNQARGRQKLLTLEAFLNKNPGWVLQTL